MEELTQSILKEYFDYKEGFLYWRKKTSIFSCINIGDIASHLNKNKNRKDLYNSTNFRNKKYRSARLVFCWHYGYFPETVDHINHDTLNDKIENLRAATHHENNRNRRPQKNATSEYLGVSRSLIVYKYKRKDGTISTKTRYSRWRAIITVNEKNKYLGSSFDEKEAALMYNEGAKKYHGEFGYLNIIE